MEVSGAVGLRVCGLQRTLVSVRAKVYESSHIRQVAPNHPSFVLAEKVSGRGRSWIAVCRVEPRKQRHTLSQSRFSSNAEPLSASDAPKPS